MGFRETTWAFEQTLNDPIAKLVLIGLADYYNQEKGYDLYNNYQYVIIKNIINTLLHLVFYVLLLSFMALASSLTLTS